MIIACFDLGTSTGYAIRKSDGMIISGVIDCKPNNFDGAGMRFIKFRDALDSFRVVTDGIDRIYYEKVVFMPKSNAAGQIGGGMMATLQAWCEDNKIPYEGINVSRIKKFITGKGNASKDEVYRAVESRIFEGKVGDYNEADALALLYYIEDKLDARA